MDWLPAFSTLLGGIFGVASTLAADAIRSRRQGEREPTEIRRRTYADFLMALTRTDSELQNAISVKAPMDTNLATNLFRPESLLALCYQVGLVASQAVAEGADKAYLRLRDIRDAAATQPLEVGYPGSEEWQSAHRPYAEAVKDLRVLTRNKIQGRIIASRHSRESHHDHVAAEPILTSPCWPGHREVAVSHDITSSTSVPTLRSLSSVEDRPHLYCAVAAANADLHRAPSSTSRYPLPY